jgi:hypothetical protein
MMTSLDMVDVLFQVLWNSSLRNNISGSIYKYKRPASSTKEDVVINSLPVNNLQLQTAVLNVNIHVPNVVATLNGSQDNSIPNTKRLKAIVDEAIPMLKDRWAQDYNFDIQQQNLFEDDNGTSHYINIRIDFYNINTLN